MDKWAELMQRFADGEPIEEEVIREYNRIVGEARLMGREEAIEELDRWLEYYPDEIFPEADWNKLDDKTKTLCSGATMRAMIPRQIAAIRRLPKDE